MIIKSGSQLLVLRYKGYKNHSFIMEHNALISESGGVWMFKIGKPIPEASIEKTVAANGVLLLRSPKSEGGQLYICKCNKIYTGRAKSDFCYPRYYSEMWDDYYWLSEEGTWFYITSIELLEQKHIDCLRLVKNGKSLLQVLNETRTVYLYVTNSEDIIA